MRLRWQILAAAMFLATPSVAEPFRDEALKGRFQKLDYIETVRPPLVFVLDDERKEEPDAIIFARMSGTCTRLKIDGHDYKCRAVAFVQNEEGRANFTVALDDPNDDSHIVSFSGDNGRRPQDNRYELPIDRMLLKSKDRPKVDGLPVPFIELSAGLCKQVGSFAAQQVSSISCNATDRNGKKYELEYESDGSPITVLRISRKTVGPPTVSPFD